MGEIDFRLPKGAIRAALARERYERAEFRIVDSDISGYSWLVASHRGLFAVSAKHAKTIAHGWFFGICRHRDDIYLFENCGERSPDRLGRIIGLQIVEGHLAGSRVVAAGLHNNCHQLTMIDERLCLLDTAGQAIIRFDIDGTVVDVQRPFAPAEPTSSKGDYLHINSIAQIGGRIAIMLHNGKVRPEKQSELAWLDEHWRVQEREPVPGYSCHDIVEDEHGIRWHCASMSGEIVGSDGRRIKISDDLMTRGLAITPEAVIVGVSTFGPRHVRETLNGGVVILDRNFRRRSEIQLPAGPADIVPL